MRHNLPYTRETAIIGASYELLQHFPQPLYRRYWRGIWRWAERRARLPIHEAR